MIKKTLQTVALGFCLLAAGSASAAVDSAGSDEAITKNLNKLLVEHFKSEPDSISESQIPGLYQVMYGTQIVYLSADGQHFISGDMMTLKTRENMTEVSQRVVRKKIIEEFDTTTVTFKAKNEKHVLRVFTDIDCGYCAKLHREMDEINAKGITVEYLAFPRAGIGSPSYDKVVSVWCADDQQDAMTKSKNRQAVPNKKCENPVSAQYQIGQALGVNGTPALLTETGKLIPGYMPADRLLAELEAGKPKTVFSQ